MTGYNRFTGPDCFDRTSPTLALQGVCGILGLWRIDATARLGNPGPVRVLQKNGFKIFGRSQKCHRLRDTWYDLLHFEQHTGSLHREEDASGYCRQPHFNGE